MSSRLGTVPITAVKLCDQLPQTERARVMVDGGCRIIPDTRFMASGVGIYCEPGHGLNSVFGISKQNLAVKHNSALAEYEAAHLALKLCQKTNIKNFNILTDFRPLPLAMENQGLTKNWKTQKHLTSLLRLHWLHINSGLDIRWSWQGRRYNSNANSLASAMCPHYDAALLGDERCVRLFTEEKLVLPFLHQTFVDLRPERHLAPGTVVRIVRMRGGSVTIPEKEVRVNRDGTIPVLICNDFERSSCAKYTPTLYISRSAAITGAVPLDTACE